MADNILELPIFPLPNVVFFPSTVLPLHIFEPRYRKMIADVLRWQEPRLGVVLLEAGWEEDYYGTPPVHSIGGMGVITDFSESEDGKYDLFLKGDYRYRILKFVQDQPYRLARVERLTETWPEKSDMEELSSRLLRYFAEMTTASDSEAVSSGQLAELDFRTQVNAISSALGIAPVDKQRLLELDHLGERALTLISILQQIRSRQQLTDRFKHLRPDQPEFN